MSIASLGRARRVGVAGLVEVPARKDPGAVTLGQANVDGRVRAGLGGRVDRGNGHERRREIRSRR